MYFGAVNIVMRWNAESGVSVLTIKIVQNIHFFMGHADNIYAPITDQVKNQVGALRETIITFADVRPMFACAGARRQP